MWTSAPTGAAQAGDVGIRPYGCGDDPMHHQNAPAAPSGREQAPPQTETAAAACRLVPFGEGACGVFGYCAFP